MNLITKIAEAPGRMIVSATPEGYDAHLLAQAMRARGGVALHIARDDARAAAMADALRFFAPDIPVLSFPAWDCLPYDRVSPRPEVVAERMACLVHLQQRAGAREPLIVVTTVNAALQRVPARGFVEERARVLEAGGDVPLPVVIDYLERSGYTRASTVAEPGDYAVRGGLLDLYPPGAAEPLRLDFFGDTLETIRRFNAEDQRSIGTLKRIALVPANEVPIERESIARFRSGYVAAFGAVTGDDPLYAAISEGRRYAGYEHWLPLFHEALETIFDYAAQGLVTLDGLAEEAADARLSQIADYHDARADALKLAREGHGAGAVSYKPLPAEALYLSSSEWEKRLRGFPTRLFTVFQRPDAIDVIDAGGKIGRDFAPERKQEINVFEAAGSYLKTLTAGRKRAIIACWSQGSAERMAGVLADHAVGSVVAVDNFAAAEKLAPSQIGLAVIAMEHGFEAPGLAVVSEQDILGDRMVRARKSRRAQNFIAEATALSTGDLVVHVEHGIGRYLGLKTLDVAGAPHDCLEIQYDGGKLFLPVENIELLTRYGSDDEGIQLDRLGGSGWQSRKAKLKNRIRDMAEQLIKVAAARELKRAPEVNPQHGSYEEFCARFPYEETEDQDRAIGEVIEDLGKGRPMDRLICGDVGFGKTEVALRAAFVAAMQGRQVAVVVPTTLLSRQHFRTFSERFKGWPIQVRQLSRLVNAKEASETRAGLASGTVDVVVGTHALLAKSIAFKDLALLIVDEEQHFGVAHKERLKQLKANVHVLTLSATPIPRTLQLALTGVKDMSIIATPPVDRLAVRTFVGPFDPLVVREALLREHYRGGQSFYVVPRISDLADAMEYLHAQVPEVKPVRAHGQMAPTQLEDVMTAFYERQYDVLVSTTIVESGLDIPTANTLIVHRADMFGLAQLYQIRGRIGRSKQRAYAYLTTPPNRTLTAGAEKRLQVLQTLDTLGAGFTLASHDLDLRGSGNLLGEEQSGHIKEVGIELYQDMLEEAVASLRAGGSAEEEGMGEWSPQISVGAPILIPESYVPDLALRLSLYRRLAEVEQSADIDGFAAELVDRFGSMPDEVKHLLKVIEIKRLCRIAAVEKIDAGPKGATISFRGNVFPKPEALILHIARQSGTMKVRPDQKIVVMRTWPDPEDRLNGAHQVVAKLAELAV
ncbi:MAG: transcription-repair coupling factor [Alphaproteobacteria bacterium]|nr:transcription-repair coupling factor [Alphaproteobacteria bacterium]